MKVGTIRGIHSILSGAFAAAQRWEWTDRNPAESAKPPTTIRQPILAGSRCAVPAGSGAHVYGVRPAYLAGCCSEPCFPAVGAQHVAVASRHQAPCEAVAEQSTNRRSWTRPPPGRNSVGQEHGPE
jgi:hypothetical protein